MGGQEWRDDRDSERIFRLMDSNERAVIKQAQQMPGGRDIQLNKLKSPSERKTEVHKTNCKSHS
jgi:hypothetical protein